MRSNDFLIDWPISMPRPRYNPQTFSSHQREGGAPPVRWHEPSLSTETPRRPPGRCYQPPDKHRRKRLSGARSTIDMGWKLLFWWPRETNLKGAKMSYEGRQ